MARAALRCVGCRAEKIVCAALDDENEVSKPTSACWVGERANCFAVGYDDGSILLYGVPQYALQGACERWLGWLVGTGVRLLCSLPFHWGLEALEGKSPPPCRPSAGAAAGTGRACASAKHVNWALALVAPFMLESVPVPALPVPSLPPNPRTPHPASPPL